MATTSKNDDSIDNNNAKETDITVYGATSFVAKHILRYLIESSKHQKFKVTLGGRNQSKLEVTKARLISEFPLLTKEVGLDICLASGSDLPGLKTLAKRSRVVLNCAGPYSWYSSLVVAACAEVGTDYVDITGEVAWVSEMRVKYGPLAKESGARIISLCGYDSIPSDIALLAAVECLREKVDGDVEIESGQLWHQMFGMANGGTVQTAVDMPIDLRNDFFQTKDGTQGKRSLRKVPYFVGDPLSLAHPKERHNPSNHEIKQRMSMQEWLNNLPWADVNFSFGVSLPMPMAPINMKVMQASAIALGYGESFTVRERYVPLGYSWTRLIGIVALLPCMFLQMCILWCVMIARTPVFGKWITNIIAPAGSGAPDFLCRMGTNSVYATATTKLDEDSATVDRGYAHMSFQGDAGNTVTAQCVSEAALTLLFDRDSLPPRSEDGFGTPAEMLGMALFKRFQTCQVRPVEIQTCARTKVEKHEMTVYIE